MDKEKDEVEKEKEGSKPKERTKWQIIWDDWIKSILVAFVLAVLIRAFIFAPTVVIGPSMEPTLDGSDYKNDRLIAERVSLLFNKVPEKGQIITFIEPSSSYYIEQGVLSKLKKYIFNTKDYIKRVIAHEGDTVKFKGEKMLLDGIQVSDYEVENDQLFVNGSRVLGNADFVIEDAQVYVNDQPVNESYLGEKYYIYVRIEDGVISKSQDLSKGQCDVNIDITVPQGCVYVMGDNRNLSFDSRKFTAFSDNAEYYAAQNGCIKVSEITGRVVFRFWPLEVVGTVK